ncbi:hypothetical protein AaE_009450 [Aphanomyces astaci]|uniref:Peptidase A2 domain-containing protein n=1 Tax=Aphanomyces astaci TaxID=112090 RepID=A0A6A5AC80_APHAT|nr:hypothetical protein AaE_009450 [Aphanomyces astaci]
MSQVRQREPQGGKLPQVRACESERLLKEQMDKWESARNRKVTKLQGSANKSLGREAKIEGIVSVTTTLLDTGSDVTLVTAGVMKALERAGVEVKVISPEPSVIQPYGQAPALKVDRQVQFKLVTLDTPCGPLALRGLKAWVDSSSNAAELLISRAVMERLGFSEDELLSHAFAKQEVWDVSDVDKWPPQATSAVMTACTVPPPTSKRRAVVEAVIQDKLRAAEDEGLTADLLEKLRLLLAKHGDVFRLEIGHDEPIKVEPLRVRIKPGAVPVKCGLRRYPPAHVPWPKAKKKRETKQGHPNRSHLDGSTCILQEAKGCDKIPQPRTHTVRTPHSGLHPEWQPRPRPTTQISERNSHPKRNGTL